MGNDDISASTGKRRQASWAGAGKATSGGTLCDAPGMSPTCDQVVEEQLPRAWHGRGVEPVGFNDLLGIVDPDGRVMSLSAHPDGDVVPPDLREHVIRKCDEFDGLDPDAGLFEGLPSGRLDGRFSEVEAG